jgi:dolichyl-phosphate beta-glucosyltransferase
MTAAPHPAATRRVTFVVPAYDEERRLGGSLQRLIEFCQRQPYESELIIVDDGSSDRTAAIASTAGESASGGPARVSFRLLQHDRNRGKGAAVRTGVLAATGDDILYLDADLATPPEEIPKLLEALNNGNDLAIGVRIQPGGYDMRDSEPAGRRIGGHIFTFVRRRLLLSDVYDTQCGFKAFRKEAAQKLFPLQRLDGWAFDAELLFMAERLGLSIRQIPVEWRHVEGSRFRITIASALHELRDLARIRWLHHGLGRQKG